MTGGSSIAVSGVSVAVMQTGPQPNLVLLDSGMAFEPAADAIALLSRSFRVLAPTHPGFGKSDRPPSMTTVDDLAYFYLDLFEQLDLRDVVLVGVSFGAWIAAELAIKSTTRLRALVLANPVGIKVSGREQRDIGDIFAMTDAELRAALFADPEAFARDYAALGEAAALDAARSREALARYAWSPYMHDPKLRDRLHRIDVDTLFLRGARDGLTSDGYTADYCALVPGARLERIAAAGHLPHIEQPEAFARHVAGLAGGRPALQVADGMRA